MKRSGLTLAATPPSARGRLHRSGSRDADEATLGQGLSKGAAPGDTDAGRRWLSIRQIAADLGVSVSTAYKWSARGSPWFPRSIRLHNGDIRVRRDWYELWLAELEE